MNCESTLPKRPKFSKNYIHNFLVIFSICHSQKYDNVDVEIQQIVEHGFVQSFL